MVIGINVCLLCVMRVSGQYRRLDNDLEQNPEVFAQELLTRFV